MTGWNLPPGCTYAMLDEACGVGSLCLVCRKPDDVCICPECPKCGSFGDPLCYEEHGLVKSPEQMASIEKMLEEKRIAAELESRYSSEEEY